MMQYSIRELFAVTTAAALLIGFAGLPADFRGFLVAFSLLYAGVGGCFYVASGRDIPEHYVIAFVIIWTAAVALVLLFSPVGW
jgi:hypothetical protein